MKNPFLKGATVYLRPIDENDLTPKYREWLNDEEVNRYNSHHRFPNYDENMRNYYERTIKSRENLVLAICAVSTDEHIGNIGLFAIDALNQSAELAIMIGDKQWWGKGVGTEAVKLLIEHGFKELNLHRIYAGTEERNVGFQKLAQSVGFTEEGRAREAIFKDGAFRNTISYGLLRGEEK